jgi:hypothetical protein
MLLSGIPIKAHIIDALTERLTPILTDAVDFHTWSFFLRSHHRPTKSLSGLL